MAASFLCFCPRIYALALVVSMLALLPSCGKKCCDCTGSEIFSSSICEDGLPSGFTSWDAYREALMAGGCSCD